MTTPPRHTSHRHPVALIAAAIIVVSIVLAAVVVIFWREWLALAQALPWLALALRAVLFGSLAAAPVVLLVTVWRRYADHRYIDAYHDEQLTLAQRWQGLPSSVTSLNVHPGGTAPDHAPGVSQLTAGVALSREVEWLAWTDQAPHLMVAGRTDSGKTTTVEAVLARRILANDMVMVIDPHYQAGKWLGAQAIGGGRDYAACYQAFAAIRALLDLRYQAFNNGTRTEDFKRVTIIVDEVPAIIAHAQAHSKALYDQWLLFASELGSEARKVRISVILSTQSPLVRDIGISSAMRENFTRIALGDTAADLLREEPSAERKQMLLGLLRGRPYPAAMEYRNNWYALRTDDVPSLARTNGAVPRAPSLLISAPAHPAQPQSPLAPTVRVPAPPTVALSNTIPDQIVLLLDGAGRYMTASEIAAALSLDLQVARVIVGKMFKAGQLSRREVKAKTTNETYEYTRPINKRPSGPLVASA